MSVESYCANEQVRDNAQNMINESLTLQFFEFCYILLHLRYSQLLLLISLLGYIPKTLYLSAWYQYTLNNRTHRISASFSRSFCFSS